MGKHGIFDATRVQLPYLCYIGGESITNPDNWKVPLPTTATVVQIGSEDGECHYALDGNFAQDNSPGYIAADGERMIGPVGGGSMQTLHLHAPDGIVHLQYYRECGRGRNERAEFQYYEKVLNLDPIAYWPLWETSGTTAECLVNSAQNGTYTGVTLGEPGIGDGRTSPRFDGVNDLVNVYSVAFRDAFNGSEGSIMLWIKAANVAMWTDASTRRTFYFAVDSDNRVYNQNTGAGPNNMSKVYEAGNVTENRTEAESSTDWICHVTTWSKTDDEVKFYRNGAHQQTFNTLGNWAGNLVATSVLIGAGTTAPILVWDGWLAHCVVWDSALSPSDITSLYVV